MKKYLPSTRLIFKQLLPLIMLSTGFASSAFADLQWKTLKPGLEYTEIPLENQGNLHAFRIDLKQNQLNLVLASEHNKQSASVTELAKLHNALLAINGGFFSPEREPLGLRIQKGETKNPLKPISWWGIFYIKNNQPHIDTWRNFNASSNIAFAVQAGPRLVVNGYIPALKENYDERSAIGITSDNKVIIVATENAALSTRDLAQILQKPASKGGLACRNALNLDGGSSTQLYAKIGSFKLNIPNLNNITDVITVTAR